MDNLIAIGLGLGLRALIDTVTHHNHRVDGSLVGLWEGAVLRHFISKYPSSLDPYIAYIFRLIVDLLWTSSWMRLVIVVLWTFMGMLLSDVGVDLLADRRFRRLTRAIRHGLIYPLLRQFSRRRSSSTAAPSRVQFFQIPPSASTTSTVRSPGARSAVTPTDVSGPTRQGAATPGLPRRPALRVPGSFSDRTSETDTDAIPPVISRENSSTSQRDGSTTSHSSSSRTPSVTFSDPLVSQTRPLPRYSRIPSRPPPVGVYSPPSIPILPPRSILSPPMMPMSPPLVPPPPHPFVAPPSTSNMVPPSPVVSLPPPVEVPPRPPSELEYVPNIPDNIEQINPVRPVISDDERSVGSGLRGNSDRSGLTTPTSDTSRPPINIYSPEPINSGLTTPDHPTFTLPPVRVLDEAAQTPSVASRNLSDVNPIPIPLRVHERAPVDDAEQVKASLLHPELLPDINTPQPSPGLVAPAQYLPSPVEEKTAMRMPEPQLPSDLGTIRLSTGEAPPAYERTPGEAEEDSPAVSVISNIGNRRHLLQRAESLRDLAEEADKRRARLKRELSTAERYNDNWGAFKLRREIDMAEKEVKAANEKAARRFYQAHNMKPEPQTIDVHRLKVPEAKEKVEQALYDAILNNAPELRIITGKGNHSKTGIPALKLAILGTMADYRIDTATDPKNSGVIIIRLPYNPNAASGSS